MTIRQLDAGVFVVTMGCTASSKSGGEVLLACHWVMYGDEHDSFVFNLDRREVYWVNEDKRYPITELTEGRIGFTGRRSSLRVSGDKTLRDVPITFSINRVTGELYLRGDGITPPPGYEDSCTATKRVL